MFRNLFLCALFLLIYACGQTDNVDLSDKYLTEKVIYQSKNIFGFENLFDGRIMSQADQDVFGILHFPNNYDASIQYPLVIASHGSSNWRDHHRRYLEQMRQADYLVFAIHPFDSRDVSSTVGNQINVTSETVIYEMAQALNLMSKDSRVDNQKIFAAGWSLGGTASLFNGWVPLQDEIHDEGADFAGYLMWYPGCLALPDLNDWDPDHMQIYIGEADNWTPAAPCIDLVKAINQEGGNANIELYPDAFHSFDAEAPLRLHPDAYSWANCKLKLSAVNKKVYDPNNIELDFSDPKARRAAYESCATKGDVMAGASSEYKYAADKHLAVLLGKLR